MPPLLAGVLARADAGIDYSGTDFAFLESIPFLAVMLALVAVAAFVRQRVPVTTTARVVGPLAIVLGALLFAGSLAEEDYAWGPGILAGALIALVGMLAATSYFEGARARLIARGESDSASLLVLFADAVAIVLTVIAVFVGPLSYVPLVFCLWLLIARRRRAESKYEGLRVLR